MPFLPHFELFAKEVFSTNDKVTESVSKEITKGFTRFWKRLNYKYLPFSHVFFIFFLRQIFSVYCWENKKMLNI